MSSPWGLTCQKQDKSDYSPPCPKDNDACPRTSLLWPSQTAQRAMAALWSLCRTHSAGAPNSDRPREGSKCWQLDETARIGSSGGKLARCTLSFGFYSEQHNKGEHRLPNGATAAQSFECYRVLTETLGTSRTLTRWCRNSFGERIRVAPHSSNSCEEAEIRVCCQRAFCPALPGRDRDVALYIFLVLMVFRRRVQASLALS